MSLILNEADDLALLLQGLEAGFNVIMHEGCPLEQSLQINSTLTKAAHQRGAAVEAELGELPTTEGHAGTVSGGASTDPGEAEMFVARTGVDALAVSIGNVHVLEARKSSLDFPLLKELARRVPVPLVLHGGTGIDEGELTRAIRMGVSKVNVGTVLRRSLHQHTPRLPAGPRCRPAGPRRGHEHGGRQGHARRRAGAAWRTKSPG